jgi:hypothetical protein
MSVKGNLERESTSAKNMERGSAKTRRQKRDISGPKQSAALQARRVPSGSAKTQARRQKDLSIIYNQCIGDVSYALAVYKNYQNTLRLLFQSIVPNFGPNLITILVTLSLSCKTLLLSKLEAVLSTL